MRCTAHDPMLEAYLQLGFLAAVTERVRLGTIVTGLDVLSEGRAFLGIGAAWYEREHLALGVPYPPLKERFERLEESLQIALQLWSDDEGPFDGKHVRLAETINVPQSIQRPHPPIVIGGSGERKTLRLVAQYGDATNLVMRSPDEAAHKLDVLRRHCDDLGGCSRHHPPLRCGARAPARRDHRSGSVRRSGRIRPNRAGTAN